MTIPLSVSDANVATDWTKDPPGSESLTGPDKRAQACALVPELASYRWTDEYFQGRDVLAVFDHDKQSVKRDQRRCSACIILWLLLSIFVWYIAIMSIVSNPGLGIFLLCFSFFVTIILMMVFIRGLKAKMPHTAVNFDGVLHTDSSSEYAVKVRSTLASDMSLTIALTPICSFALSIDETYLFPCNEIVYVDGATIKLAHCKIRYNERPARIDEDDYVGPLKCSFTRLQNPALFGKTVLALKQLNQEARVAAL